MYPLVHNVNEIMTLKGANTSTTRYQYSALAMRICDLPITKSAEALFSLRSCMQRCLHARSAGKITVTEDIWIRSLINSNYGTGFEAQMAQSKFRPKIRNIRRAVKHTVTADHGSIDGDISAFVCLLAK